MNERKSKFHKELALYKATKLEGSQDKVYYHLGRAHVLAQNSISLHLKVHCLMFMWAIRSFDAKEVLAQVLRLLVIIPGHIFGRIPKGNIGWSTVGLIQEMDISNDLKLDENFLKQSNIDGDI